MKQNIKMTNLLVLAGTSLVVLLLALVQKTDAEYGELFMSSANNKYV